jgi:hypothetical protein
MFCPKCSQQQVSDETRFCSRCGFQLNVVKALIASDESEQDALMRQPGGSLRKRDMTIGAFLMFLLALFGAIITMDMPAAYIGRLMVVVFAWVGLTLLINIKPIIQYFLRGDSSASNTEAFSPSKAVSRLTSKNKKSLREAYSIPAADLVMPRVNTAEMVSPPSVVEQTTNLLDQK